MGRIGPKSVVPVVRHVDFEDTARIDHPVKFLHDRSQIAEIRADMLEDMLHQNMIERVGGEVPWRLFDVEQKIGFAGGETIGIEPALALVETAAEIELGGKHRRTSDQLVRAAA